MEKKYQLNKANWSDERVQNIIKYLRDPSSDPDLIKQQLDYYKNHVFQQKNGRLFVAFNGVAKEVLSDSKADARIKRTFEKKDKIPGRVPTLFHTLNRKYVNIGWSRVQRVLKSLTSYQLHSARQLSKPKRSGMRVDARRVGGSIEGDLMFFSLNNSGKLTKKANDGYVGLAVVVDAMSGFTGAAPFRSKSEAAGLTIRILKQFGKLMTLRGGKFTTDSGSEYIGVTNVKGNSFTDAVTALGLKYEALPSGRPAVHVENKNKQIRENVNAVLFRKQSKRWIDVWKKVVVGLNTTSFTDWRAPHMPKEIIKWSPAKQKKLFSEGVKAKDKKKITGARVAALKVGDSVRIALEGKQKGPKLEAKGPKQKWSAKVYTVAKVSQKGMYTLEGLPKRRFARYWLQHVPAGSISAVGKNIKERGTRTYHPSKKGPQDNYAANKRAES